MSYRKRISLSVSPQAYEALEQMQRKYGFKNLCEMVSATLNVLLDRERGKSDRSLNIPDDDWAYIDQMFKEFANAYSTPDGIVPKQHRTKRIDK